VHRAGVRHAASLGDHPQSLVKTDGRQSLTHSPEATLVAMHGELLRRTLTLMRFLTNSSFGTQPDAVGYRGFYYDFLDGRA
jgi:hypothetical protein